MSWIQKSEDSFKSTNKLIGDSLYNTSVHCSYYSCIQLILFVVNSKLGITPEEIDTETKTKGSHNWLIGQVIKALPSTERRKARKLNDDIQELKRQRVIADYSNEQIVENKAKELRQLSFDINKYIKTSFSI